MMILKIISKEKLGKYKDHTHVRYTIRDIAPYRPVNLGAYWQNVMINYDEIDNTNPKLDDQFVLNAVYQRFRQAYVDRGFKLYAQLRAKFES